MHFDSISIHALLAESDDEDFEIDEKTPIISIHALLAESDALYEDVNAKGDISIHALLAESDKS